MAELTVDSTAPFLRACRRQSVAYTPVWFMRQAGRYMTEYRVVRAKHTLLEICAHPDVAAEVTLQPVRALGVDAAILFADILLPLPPMGVNLTFAAGEGPVIANPISTLADVTRLRPLESDPLPNVTASIRLVRQELAGRVPLIGFAGGPFTLASYLIEGGASRDYRRTKEMMYGAPDIWHTLMSHLATATTVYLQAQIRAGAEAIQLFDSWIGCLSPDDYSRYALPYSRQVFSALSSTGVPTIHFGTGTATLLALMRDAGGNVLGLDWRIPLDDGWQRVGHDRAIQGNLDPVVLFAPRAELQERIADILSRAAGRPGHIFNLGHGILPNTPVDNVRAAVEMVHEFSVRERYQ